ncbi:MAG: twin-arginine translocase TatA/TatE family subunit [Marinilabiliaceae bacterium]|nr:twin-arginine translocase TatA/TatE family subunit [Marinilabiliaceae bacterium]
MKLLLFNLGGHEIIIIALLVLLFFGGKRIPELMKGIGKGVKSFKDGLNDSSEKSSDDDNEKEISTK